MPYEFYSCSTNLFRCVSNTLINKGIVSDRYSPETVRATFPQAATSVLVIYHQSYPQIVWKTAWCATGAPHGDIPAPLVIHCFPGRCPVSVRKSMWVCNVRNVQGVEVSGDFDARFAPVVEACRQLD